MEKVYYNKLIRDKIPDKILKKGSCLKTRELKEKEFEELLARKIVEEARELVSAGNKEEITVELADLLDIIEEFRKLKKIKPQAVKKRWLIEKKKKGGFKKRLFLVWSSRDDYQDQERKYKF